MREKQAYLHGKYYYTVYGLNLCANHPLPEVQLAPSQKSETNLVKIYLVGDHKNLPTHLQCDQAPFYSSPDPDNKGRPSLQVWRDAEYYHLVYYYDNQFLVSRSSDSVWCSWPAGSDFGLVIAHLLGPVIGLVLHLRDVLVLHGSVIAINGNALAVLGVSGAGKSTIAWELCRQGCQLLSDDLTALKFVDNKHFLVQPGYPRLRVWPQTADALYGPGHNLRPIVPGRIKNGSEVERFDKRYLDQETGQFVFIDLPQPLSAIYILEWLKIKNHPRITPLGIAEGLAIMDSLSYMSYLLDKPAHIRQLLNLSHISQSVILRKLHPSDELASLPSLVKELLHDFDNLVIK